MLKLMTFMDAPYTYRQTKKLIKVILYELNKSPGTLETLRSITIKYFAHNVFAEYSENDIIKNITYQEMFDQSNLVRNNVLTKYANKKGAIVLQMQNSPNWYIAFWGIISAGFKPILIDPKIKKLTEILQGVEIITSITDDNFHHFLQKQTYQLIVPYTKEIAFLSSGTTETPKIITYDVLSLKMQIALASDILQKNKAIRMGNKLANANKIKVLAFLPLFHIFGFMVIVIWFSFFGRTIVFLNSLTNKSIQQTCQNQHVTHFFAVPLVWENVVNNLIVEAEKQNKLKKLKCGVWLSNLIQNVWPSLGVKMARNILFKKVRQQILGNDLQFCISGGAQINKKYLWYLNGIGCSIHNGYGLTESGIVSVELSKYVRYRNQETVGKPFKIIEWQTNKQKELQIKSGLLFKSKMLHGELIVNDSNVWYDTKDIIKVKKGRWQIIGRVDDVIIGGDGENICPEELENKLNVSSLYTCGILGVKQRSGSHQINLLIYFQPNLSADQHAKLIEKIYQIVETIPIYKRPIKFYLTDKLPLTNLGKVRHKQLLSMYLNHELKLTPITKNLENVLRLTNDEKTQKLLIEIRKCFAKIFNVDVNTIHDNTNFITDLGGSSIDYYGLLNEIFLVTHKEIKLVGNNILLTPLDFAIYIVK